MTKPNYVPGPKEQELTGKIIRLHYNSEAAWLPVIAAFNEARDEIVATTRTEALLQACRIVCYQCSNGDIPEFKVPRGHTATYYHEQVRQRSECKAAAVHHKLAMEATDAR